MNTDSRLTTALLLLLAAAGLSASSADNSIENSTQAAGRSGRKDYDVVYTPPDGYPQKKSGDFFTPEDALKRGDDSSTPSAEPGNPPREDPPPQSQVYSPPTYYRDEYVPYSYYKPRPRYYTDDPMYKSGTSVNWNVWKGDAGQPPAQPPQPPPSNSKGGGPPPDFTEYFMTEDAWKGDPWTPDQMASMMAMMNQMQGKPKLGGLLSRLTQDPGLLLMAAILPLSMILAAVLPTLVNMAMNGGIPMVTTTATGNANAARGLDSTEFLSPVLQTIATFGARTLDHPGCAQRIFCQVTRGPPANGTEDRSFQKALFTASRLIDGSWLEDFGVKALFDSMGDGDCDKIPCSTHGPKQKPSDKGKRS